MINVLHLRDTNRVCGPGKTIIETACITDRREFTQTIGLFLLHREDRNEYREAAERRGVEVIPLRSSHPYDPRIVNSILDAIRRHDIHILHSHEYKSDLLAFAVSRVSHVRIMTTIHGWIEHSVKRRVMVRLSQSVLRYFDRVVAVSAETRRRVLSCGVPPSRVVTIHNGIVTDRYHASAHEPGLLRRRFDLPDAAVLVGSIGRLSPEKGQQDLIKAVATLAPRLPWLHVAFVGDGPDRAHLEAQAEALGLRGRVLFTGFVDDVRPVYRDLDVLALTSHTEGLPNVVLEALCMNTPVLATDVGGTGEVIQDGVTGVLVPAHAPDRIASGLAALVENREWARSLAARGRQLVQDQFEFEKRVRQEEDVYHDILRNHTRHAVAS